MTVTGAESRVRNAFQAIFQKSKTLQDAPDPETGLSPTPTEPQPPPVPQPKKTVTLVRQWHNTKMYTYIAFIVTYLSTFVFQPRERVIDMSIEDQKAWEEEQMNHRVDFSRCHIDAAPFQLVAKTTLLKVHSLFSLLGINHAYVTATGKLIGVVAMKELRLAIEQCNAGNFQPLYKEMDESSTDGELLSPTDGEKNSIDELNSLDSALDTEAETETDDESLR